MKNRLSIPKEYKWNLADIYPSIEAYQSDFSALKSAIPSMDKYRNNLTKDNTIECLLQHQKWSIIAEKLYIYANLKKDENTADNESQSLAESIEMLLVSLSEKTSFLVPELSKFSSATLLEMSKSPIYTDFDIFFKNIIRDKKHILSSKEEMLLSQVSSFSRDFKSIFGMFDNADITFGSIKDDLGKLTKLSHGTYSLLLQNPSQAVRAAAFKTYYKSFISHSNTLTATYQGLVKKNVFFAKARKYKSVIASALDSEHITQKTYDNLIKSVAKYTPMVHRYVALRKQALKLEELHMYDMYVPITKDYKLTLGYEDAYQVVVDALSPLGSQYKDLLLTAKSSGWIDVEETPNKRSGAYSWGAYTSHPYVLLNYEQTTHDIFTIAHELGHAIHSYMSNQTQPYQKASYEIFVAEVASTVNEVLLLKYLLQKAVGEEKKFLLSYYLDMFRTTLFRQTMFSEFEVFAHKTVEAGEPLTKDLLCNYYLTLNQKYYGTEVISDKEIAYEWSRIPHFYNAFYVYKYATGLTSAVSIATKIYNKEEGFLNKYFDFLSGGGSKTPLELLKLVDVDLETISPYTVALNDFCDTLEELERLI